MEAFGYKAETTQPNHDYGVDVIAENHRRRVIIQCKLYGRGRIGGNTIMQLLGSREFFDATDAICLTTSHAREIAAKRNVHLIDREMLLGLSREKSLTIPSLTVLQTQQEDVLPMRAERIRIGRAEDNDVVLSEPQVSRYHAVLERTGMHLCVRDGGSTNGTFVEGQRIVAPAQLNYGSIISIGTFRFEVMFQISASSQ